MNIVTVASEETIRVLCVFDPFIEVDLPPFIDDFHPKIEVTLDGETFIFVLLRSPCLSFNGLMGMVYEFLQDCFVLNNFANGFDLFKKICGHIVRSHVPSSISCLFSTSQILTLEK